MRFGMSADEAKDDKRFQKSGGGKYINRLKEGDNTLRIVQEPKDWLHFAEHFNPNGFSFPCNGEDACPGCTSTIDKMKSTSPQVAFNALSGEYLNVYSIPRRLADKLMLRFDRLGTITDRAYTITKYKNSSDKVDYEVEGDLPAPLAEIPELRDIEKLLQDAWDESWGDSAKVKRATEEGIRAMEKRESEQDDKPPFSQPDTEQRAVVSGEAKTEAPADPLGQYDKDPWAPPSEPMKQGLTESELKALDEAHKQAAEMPSEEVVVTEEQLRSMTLGELQQFCKSDGTDLPDRFDTTDEAVDWLLTNA